MTTTKQKYYPLEIIAQEHNCSSVDAAQAAESGGLTFYAKNGKCFNAIEDGKLRDLCPNFPWSIDGLFIRISDKTKLDIIIEEAEQEYEDAFEKAVELGNLRDEKSQYERIDPETVTEIEKKKDILQKLDKKISALEAYFRCEDIEPEHHKELPHNPNGRNREPLREALEYAWDKMKKQGNTAVLEPGNLSAFLVNLKKMIDENSEQFSEYVVERIEYVKPKSLDDCIKTQDKQLNKKKHYKSKTYKRDAISKALSTMRKEKNKLHSF